MLSPPPPDSSNVLATERYLRALNSIFERTLLGNHTRFFRTNGTGMQHLEEGFSYFEEWAREVADNKGFDNGINCKQFISWQVFLPFFCFTIFFNLHSVLYF